MCLFRIMKTGGGTSSTSSTLRLRNNKPNSFKHTTKVIPRQNSLPVSSSSPIEPSGNSPRSYQDTTDFLAPVEEGPSRPFRPRSAVLSSSSSGLPAMTLKGNQHPYIARKGSQKKGLQPGKRISESISPDLITTTCEEILRMANAADSTAPADLASTDDPLTFDSNTTIIDCAEDCLDGGGDVNHQNEAMSNHRNQVNDEPNAEEEFIRPLERTFSDALIIPDPFEREPDDILSPDPNMHNVNNLIV